MRFLNSTGGGKITRIEGQIAYVDDDGFETPVLLKEVVVVMPAGHEKGANAPKVMFDQKAFDEGRKERSGVSDGRGYVGVAGHAPTEVGGNASSGREGQGAEARAKGMGEYPEPQPALPVEETPHGRSRISCSLSSQTT